MDGVHLHMRTCPRADAPLFLYLGNGRTDCTEILCVVREPSARHFTKVWGGVSAARAHVHTPFSYLGNGLMDCAEIWYAVRDPLDKRFTEIPII